MVIRKYQLYAVLGIFAAVMSLYAKEDLTIDVDAEKQGPVLQDTLYGVFYEDINYAGDGGLYAELVQNRSFEYAPVEGWEKRAKKMQALYAWEKVELDGAVCEIAVMDKVPLNANNTKYVKLSIRKSGGGAGLRNTGFEGISVVKGEKYRFSFYARREGFFGGSIKVSICGADDSPLAETEFGEISSAWQKFEAELIAGKTDAKATLVLLATESGEICMDMISLFPAKTFKNRPNGLRPDLAQAIADLKPATFRFPGGCIVHGQGLSNAYRWKDTVGDVAERKPNWNLWGYHQTYGLGYFEYLQFCEDIGAAPLPIMPLGISCGFRKPFENAEMDNLQEWIDDVLDLVEFANGPVDSKWGALRASMGHPAPFNLKYIGLGNEEHHTKEFEKRFPVFVKALRDKHPEIIIVGTSGLGPEIPIYNFMHEQQVTISDEHYYMAPEWFIESVDRFDSFDRSKPKIYVGEYASRGNRQFNAVAEAVFLTGIERNADIVHMTAYAPMLARYEFTQWQAADLIWFDHERVVLTPNYHVQQMFSVHKGDHYVPNTATLNFQPEAVPIKTGEVGLATWNTTVEYDDFKVVGDSGVIIQDDFSGESADWRNLSGAFSVRDGVLVQSDDAAEPARCSYKKAVNQSKATISLRARKTGGREGFMIVFGAGKDQYYWWNIGGWGNTRHAIEFMDGIEKKQHGSVKGSIESDRWYDLKVEIDGSHVKCYIDGNKIHDFEEKPKIPKIGVSVAKDKAAGELIIKIANPLEQALSTAVNLNGIAQLKEDTAKVITLSGAKGDMNDLKNPEKVRQVQSTMKVAPQFTCDMPAMSVKFIRIKVE